MSAEWQAYVKDPRSVCKYGLKCYQKNPDHHKNFKHPPVNSKRKGEHNSPAGKRLKPPPKHVKSPITPKNTHKDEEDTCKKDEKQTSEKQDKKHNQSVKSDEASSSPKDEKPPVIKLPENLSFHDKNDHTLFQELFLVDMPDDFFKFYECLQEEQDFVKTLANVNLELIGPYDLLMGKLPVLDDRELYLIHWRFFYDPPEFQAVLKKKGKSEYHIGYFRDAPDAAPEFLAHNDSAKCYLITPMATNIFGALYLYLQNEKKSSPFTSMACQKLMEKVKHWAEAHKYSLEEFDMKTRLAQSVTKGFHGAGIVVPYDKKTELGYRKLVETNVNLKKLFARLGSCENQTETDVVLSALQPVITYASIAVDEGDLGTGLECGMALLASGARALQPAAVSALAAAYPLLGRDQYRRVVEAHMKYRRKGPNMSVLSLGEP